MAGFENLLAFINILLIVGIAQGLLLAFRIFHRSSALYANRFLGFLVLIFSLSLTHVYLDENNIYQNDWMKPIFQSFVFLIGPFHFLYTISITRAKKSITAFDWIHFIPFVLIATLLTSLPDSMSNSLLIEYKSTGIVPINWLFIIQLAPYNVFSIRFIKNYSFRLKSLLSTTDQLKLNWLKSLTYLMSLLTFIFFLENFLNLFQANFTSFHLSSMLGATYVLSMGYIGLSKSEILSTKEVLRSLDYISSQSFLEEINENSEVAKYEKSGLSDDLADSYKSDLIRLMETEQPYTDNELTLSSLAAQLSITPHHLSEVLNTRLNQSFFDFVNKYRVKQIIKDMEDEKKKHLTLYGIAIDAGFRSKSSFNSIFKKHTGLTPSEYRKNLLEK